MFGFAFDKVYLEAVGVAEFRHDLTTYAAGSNARIRILACTSDNGYRNKIAFAFADCLEYGNSLCANGGGKSGVFNIASGVYLAGTSKKSCSDLEIGVG